MPRFFLNSREGDFLVVDLEGTNFADLDAARVEALICAREMLGDEIKTHRARGAWHYEITDAAGQVLATVSPKDALTLQPADIKPRQGWQTVESVTASGQRPDSLDQHLRIVRFIQDGHRRMPPVLQPGD